MERFLKLEKFTKQTRPKPLRSKGESKAEKTEVSTSNKRLQSFGSNDCGSAAFPPPKRKNKTPRWSRIYRGMVLNLLSQVPLVIMTQARSRSTRPRDSTAGEIQLMKIFEGILGTKLLARKAEPCFFVSFQQRCFWWNKMLHLSQLGPWNTSILETIFKTCFAKRWYTMVLNFDE